MRYSILLSLLLVTFSELGTGSISHPKTIEESSTLRKLLDEISEIYNRSGPKFNSFHYSDEFHFFACNTDNINPPLVDVDHIVKQLVLFAENASDWGAAKEKSSIKKVLAPAIIELKTILGKKKYKLYEQTKQYSSTIIHQSYYVGDGYQLSFEEVEAD